MKIKEVRELSTKELVERMDAEMSSLNQKQINHSISPLDNPALSLQQDYPTAKCYD